VLSRAINPPAARTVLCVLVAIATLGLLAACSAFAEEPAWTTYHHDGARSGLDPDASAPTTPTRAWQSVDLGAPMWNQPVVLGSRAYVGTVGDVVAALDTSTGSVVWQRSVGTPVPSAALPCGDVYPTVGIVSTPVIDAARRVLYVVADTWDGTTPHHDLVGLALDSGAEVLRTPVDPPGVDPKTLLQRSALNLDEGSVVFGFGGNFGSCSRELAPVVAVPESGGPARFWQTNSSPPPSTAGGVWATSGVAVDGSGPVYAATANPLPPQSEPATAYDYSNSVVALDLGADFTANPAAEPRAPLGWFEPSNWAELSNNDLDLGSAGTEPLPGNMLFQAGKDGRGYLIDRSTLTGAPGSPAAFEGQTCGGSGSFGGDSFANGTIYLPCTNGVQALAYNQAARSFTPLWKGPADAFGSPILSAGTVWVEATGGFNGGGTTVYGLDPATGARKYALTVTPITDHFGSPTAAGGHLFVATGPTVTAFTISEASNFAVPGLVTGIKQPNGRPSRVPTLLHTKLRAGPRGRVRIALRCLLTGGQCKGTITLRAKLAATKRVKGKRIRRTVFVALGHVRFNHRKGSFAVVLKLGRSARALLRLHHGRLALQVVLAAPPSKTVRRAATLTEVRAPSRR
jgi:polyvinyl alcohol dehydrogenase (cytochrome)